MSEGNTENEELKTAIEALSAKNRELLGELKQVRAKARGADIDPTEYANLQTAVEELTDKLFKSEKESGRTVETLQKTLQQKDATLQTYLIENGLSDALLKANVRPEMMTAVKAMLKGNTKLSDDNGQYKAILGDKPLSEAVLEWAASDEGKHFVQAPANAGGGASGGNSGGNNFQPKGNLGGDKDQRVNALKARFPDLAANG
jgi:hypothetical protein